MRRFLLIILTAASLFACCSCSALSGSESKIAHDGRELYNERLGSVIVMDAIISFPMKPGKIYDDYLEFETHYYNDEPAEPGVYNGTCYILTVPDRVSYGEKTKHSVEF